MPLQQAEDAEVGSIGSRTTPDRETYTKLNAQGMVAFFTARDSGENLLGYSLFYTGPNPNYVGEQMAFEQGVYLVPEARGLAGARFMQACDEMLRVMGFKYIARTCTVKHDLTSMYERMGYTLLEKTFMRAL